MTTLRTQLNDYLFVEFGVDGEPAKVTDSWPFELTFLVDLAGMRIFEFHDDEAYFAFAGRHLDFMPQAGMTLDDLRLQLSGSAWIGSRRPVDLDTSRLGDTSIPSTSVRRERLMALGSAHVPVNRLEIVEGLFLETEDKYLGLFRDIGSDTSFVAGIAETPIYVGFPHASAPRRTAWAVGAWLAQSSDSTGEHS